jgi:hypothetical protein
MPPQSYLRVHPEARLAPGELEVLKTYLESLQFQKASDVDAAKGAAEQSAKWMIASAPSPTIRTAPNGIEFPRDYKHWNAISSTDRSDNNTMRLVLGNEEAIKAIAAGQINPWPDGTMFAKVAWEKSVDADGVVHTGKFRQVEFMIKGARNYADTKGWGWARWLGTDLQPFGTNRTFTESCVGCHMPMRENDFVFTIPLKSER